MSPGLKLYGKRVMLVIGVAVNVFALMVTLFTAYSGYIDPDTMPFAGLAGMTFGIWLVFDMLLIAVDLVFKKILALLPVMAMCVSAGPVLTFSPVNIIDDDLTPDERSRSFKVLNYNILHFADIEDRYPDGINRTLHYIIEADADVVCLQECDFLTPFSHYCVTKEQIDTLNSMYPYHYIGRSDQSVLSKYPVKNMPLPHELGDKGDIAAYRLTIDGHDLTIFNVHLQSIGLTVSDKELFLELTDVSKDKSLRRIRSQLVSKLYDAYRQRASQARRLCQYVEEIGGNVILCGDFNDIPGCYALRTIEKSGLRDVYAEVAFGPVITYSANRFYFRIDHVLYKGDFYPVSIVRGNVRSSDHYPLLTTYVWAQKTDKSTIK